MQFQFMKGDRRWGVGLGVLALGAWALTARAADDTFRPTPAAHGQRSASNYRSANNDRGSGYTRAGGNAGNDRGGDDQPNQNQQPAPRLSESTALLESAVRDMYKTIEPNSETPSSPNELLAYADLRALRLYAGALEVAGWSLENAADDYRRHQDSGAYRNGRAQVNDPQAAAALEKFRAYRETVRTLLFRVRETAVSVEHQVSFCAPEVIQNWEQDVLPTLRMTIASTAPLFQDQVTYSGYGVAGSNPPQGRVTPTSGNGTPRDAVDVGKNPTFAPYDGKGQGGGRYFEIRAFGGVVRVKSIRFNSYEDSFGTLGTNTAREILVDAEVEPGQPLFVACNRGRSTEITQLEIEWETADNRRSYGTLDLVENGPDDNNGNNHNNSNNNGNNNR